MSFKRAFKLICGFAGGSGLLLLTADSRGYLGETGGTERFKNFTIFGVLQAAQPQILQSDNQNRIVAPSGIGWDNNWDKRDPGAVSEKKRSKRGSDEEVENNKPKATRNIFLIRHSQYILNGNGDKEQVLTVLGREQADLTGQRLAALGLKYDVMIHSTMARATETTHIISKHLPEVEKVSCDLLREGCPIEPVPRLSFKPDSVYHEDGARIEAAFRRYIHRADAQQQEDSNEIIVCHANVIRYFVCRALQFPPEGWLRLCLNNGSITWLTIRPSGRVGLRMLGDSGFMPPDKLTRT